jgi:hypothetical protein
LRGNSYHDLLIFAWKKAPSDPLSHDGFISKAFHKEQMKSTGQLWFHPAIGYPFDMTVKILPLEEIAVENELFRISEELESAALVESVSEIGQLNPVILLDQGSLKVVICGFRRIRALESLGKSKALVRIISENNMDLLRGLELSMRDNLIHRKLNALEKARILFKLQNSCGLSKDTLVNTYLPLLGLARQEAALESHLRLHGTHSALRQCLTEGRMTQASAECLSERPHPVQERVSLVMNTIQLSSSMQKKVFSILEELSAMSDSELDAPLKNAEVLSVLDDSRLSPFQKGEKLYEILYRIRFPRLSETEARFNFARERLRLPGSIRIRPHPFFETADLHVEFEASTAKRFRELASALATAAQSPDLDKLFTDF